MELRRVWRKQSDGSFIKCRMIDLRAGDTFRVDEGDNEHPILNRNGESEFVAVSDGYPLSDAEGVAGVNALTEVI